MDKLLSITIVTLALIHVAVSREYPLGRGNCGLTHDRGTVCTESNGTQPQIMYHFDKTTGMCLAFKYNGCGGNENRFETKSECHRACIPMDYGSCALFKEPFKNAKGETVLCGRDDGYHNYEKCPAGYECKYFAFFGHCCEEKNEQLFDKNLSPKCAIGKPKTVPHGGFNSLLVGKTCEDDFCPVDHKCHQLEIFAHCCPN